MFQTHIFCLVRELPDKKLIERIRATMIQYGMIASMKSRATAEQLALEAKLTDRVEAIKGILYVVKKKTFDWF